MKGISFRLPPRFSPEKLVILVVRNTILGIDGISSKEGSNFLNTSSSASAFNSLKNFASVI